MLLYCRVANIPDCLFNYCASPCLTPTYRTVLWPWTIWKVPLQGNGPTQQRIWRTALCLNGNGTWATWLCPKRFGCYRLLLQVSRNGHSPTQHTRESSRVCEWAISLLFLVHQQNFPTGHTPSAMPTQACQTVHSSLITDTHRSTLYIYSY